MHIKILFININHQNAEKNIIYGFEGMSKREYWRILTILSTLFSKYSIFMNTINYYIFVLLYFLIITKTKMKAFKKISAYVISFVRLISSKME